MSEVLPVLFPRGPGPLVSIMISSRGRAGSLIRSVTTTYELSSKQHPIEFVIKADEDDLPTFQAVQFLADRIPCKFTVVHTPRGNGFADMCDWVNRMCSKAEGDWLALLNDDACIITPDWDLQIYHAAPECVWPGIEGVCLILLSEEDFPRSYSFPVLRRKTYELLGHFACSILCDLWISQVMSSLGVFFRIPVMVHHDRIPHQNDDTRKGVAAAMNKGPRRYTIEQMRLWQKDVGVILDHMEAARDVFVAYEKEQHDNQRT